MFIVREKTRLFLGGFMVTTILVGALCGFAAVDLTTDRYMPGAFGPMFEISSLSGEGMRFSFMGEPWLLSFAPLEEASRVLREYRGVLPAHLRAAQASAAYAYRQAAKMLEKPEE